MKDVVMRPLAALASIAAASALLVTLSATVFAADTPKIVIHIELKDAVVGAKVEAAWIAVKTDAAPANYKIDAATVTLDNALDEATFGLSKPTAGWPAGTYQVELRYDGTLEETVPFSVNK